MKTIDGITLKRMIISGANNLFNCYPEVDALNVFPVPDGDTGTNMNLTMSSGAKEVQNRNDASIYEIAKAFSKGLLMGARGNSGVILSQIFRGFAKGLEGKDSINAVELAEAFVSGRKVAYNAVMKPVEGTILTVIRESSAALMDVVDSSMNIEKAFEILIKEANASLLRTPELLPVLKEVGVVDSGGTGLIKILDGFMVALKGDIVEKSMATVTSDSSQPKMMNGTDDEEGYCLEVALKLASNPHDEGKKIFVEKRFDTVIGSHGDLKDIKKEENLVKIHIHTTAPGSILTYAQQYGEFDQVKLEKITKEDKSIFTEEILPTSSRKKYALIAVAIGDGIEEMFKELRVDIIVSGGQTMNPSAEDFLEAIKKCNAEHVFILPNNSNIVMAASQACDIQDDCKAVVIPSKTIPQGLVACMMFNPEADPIENEKEMSNALKTIKSGQVTFAIKDTSIDGVDVKKDQFIGIQGKKIVCCEKSRLKTTEGLIDSMVDESSSIITLILGSDVDSAEEEKLQEYLQEKYLDVELDLRHGNQPVYSYIIGVE